MQQVDGLTVVSLSRRNINALLQQMNDDDNPETAQIMRGVEGVGTLIVLGEEDAEHYPA